MTKVLIWPDLYREQGHWLPCINLAKSLQDAGYSVEFMGIPDCASIVAPYGGTFHPILEDIYPLGHSVEDRLEPIGQRWKPHHLLPIVRGALDSVFTSAEPPDLMVSGYFNALETLLIHHKYGLPCVTITTYLRHPDDDPAIFAKTKLAFMSEPMQRKLIEGVTGNAELSLEQFVSALETQPEIIPCPREFDFYDEDWVHRDNVSYVEPMIERVPLDGGTRPEDPTNIPTDKKLIYATSGSQVEDYGTKAREFFNSLIAMMRTQGMDQYHLVLGVGERLLLQLKAEHRTTLPSNVSLFDWVSQLDILKGAEVAFVHGGLATIKESIWEKVPVVVVPHGKDQRENAMRIRRNGLGITASLGATPQKLRQQLTEVTTSPWIRRKLSKMHDVFDAYENRNPKDSVSLIEAIVAP